MVKTAYFEKKQNNNKKKTNQFFMKFLRKASY